MKGASIRSELFSTRNKEQNSIKNLPAKKSPHSFLINPIDDIMENSQK